jgi:hypothetical protein
MWDSPRRGNGCGWALMPPASSAPSRRPRRIARWSTSRICQRTASPSVMAGNSRRWSCCPPSPVVGRRSSISSASARIKRACKWQPSNCSNWLGCFPIVPSWPAIAGTVARRFCWPPRACPSTNCCASNASASCIAPRKDGERFQCGNASTYGQADGGWQGEDATGHRVQITWWTGLHLPKARHLAVTVLRVVRPSASGKQRDPHESGFLWDGPTQEGLPQVALDYRRRFGQEHGYRFDKQALLWTQPRLRTPAQFERWSQIVAIVHNLLVLARPMVPVIRRPWESTQRAASPQQVRRAMAKIVAQLGTPAPPPKPRGKSPGRPKGAIVRPAPRFPVIYQSAPGAKKRRK